MIIRAKRRDERLLSVMELTCNKYEQQRKKIIEKLIFLVASSTFCISIFLY